MVGIKGIGGIQEPTPERPANVRDRKTSDTKSPEAKDDLLISSEAQAAATLARTIQIAKSAPQVRPEKVAQAKERLEREDYKRPEVVREVAKRVAKYLE
ncbi:MAG TPA: hypothetical protein HPP77_11605 [Candidatus Hydrogenedentes bacterium]|nr:hypothetical protein [Candidatus Hydrogenedentota bacterium]